MAALILADSAKHLDPHPHLVQPADVHRRCRNVARLRLSAG
jgi:hypothetical protein